MQFLKAIFYMLLTAIVPFAVPAYAADNKSIYDFTLTTVDGQTLDMRDYMGKTILIVNTASKCGFTGQYDDLQALWMQYRNRGLVVIAIPSNDFGGQEPGHNDEIKTFCRARYNVTFPIAAKQHVTGKDTSPLFVWLEQKLGSHAMPKWNFYKYLINSQGQPVAWFMSPTRPTSDRIVGQVEANLPPSYTLEDSK